MIPEPHREQIAAAMHRADLTWNAMRIAETAIKIMLKHPEVTLLDLEDVLRENGSRTTYLVAWPREAMPREVTPVNLDNEPMPYALWVCVNGVNDMLHQLHVFGLTIEQNREALKLTGFSTPVAPVLG